MPIPDPGIYRPSHLTRKQQDEQERVIRGVAMSEFTQEDIEKMRRMVQDHDAKHKGAPIIDLNNPPKEPYKFQKFPMMVYNHAQSEPARDKQTQGKNGLELVHVPAKRVSKVVKNEHELELALKAGWSEQAPEFEAEADAPEEEEAGGVEVGAEEEAPVRRGGRGRGAAA